MESFKECFKVKDQLQISRIYFICVFLILNFFIINLRGQNNSSVHVEYLIEQSKKLRNSRPDSALFLAIQAIEESYQINNLLLISSAYNQVGILYRHRGELDSAKVNFERRLLICKALEDSFCIAKTWHNLGIISRKQGFLSEALDYELKYIPYLEKSGDSISLAHVYNSLGNIYNLQMNWPEAVNYYKRALDVYHNVNSLTGEARIYYNLGVIFYQQNELATSDSLFKLSLNISKKLGNKRSMANAFRNLGVIQKDRHNFKQAVFYFEKSANLQHQIDDKEGQLYTLLSLGDLYKENAQWENAEKKYHEALSLAIYTGLKEEELTIRESLSISLEYQGKLKEAIAQLNQSYRLKDTLRNESTNEHLLELQEKYETDKKEKENQLLQQDIALKSNELQIKSQSLLIRNVVLGVLMIVLIFSIALLINYRKRIQGAKLIAKQQEQMNQQKMLELVRDQELEFVNATLIGQETERKRIAADLHDGLSNMLVTAKLNFENLEDQLVKGFTSAKTNQLSNDQSEVLKKYNKAIGQMDDLCKRTRNLAHTMSSENSTFSLKPALMETAAIINQSGQLKVELATFGLDRSIGIAVENTVFHILRELIGNCLKHANANNLFIQLTSHEEHLNILVEDDGSGFNRNALKKDNQSLGLANLESRVENLEGELNIDSVLGRGTVITIDIPIKKSIEEIKIIRT